MCISVVQWCWSHAIEDLPHGSQGVLHGTEKAEIQIKIPRRSHGCLTQAVAWHTSANVLPCLFISASLPTLIIRIVMTLIQTQTQIKIQTQTYTNTQLHKYTDYGSHNVCTCSSTTTARTTLIIHRWWYFPVQGNCCTSLCTILCTMHTWYKETANNCAHHCTPGVYRLEVIRNLWLHLRVASAVFPYHYRYTLYMYTLPLYIPYHYTFWNKYEVNQLPT